MSQPKVIDPLVVDDILFIHGQNPQNAKRIKRKFHRKQVLPIVTQKLIAPRKLETEAVSVIYEHLSNVKRKHVSTKKGPQCVCVLFDTNVLLNNITRLPPPPLEWDVLCCESDVSKYNYKNPNNNIYWCATDITDTHHFVVNMGSIDKVLGVLKESKNWRSFVDKLQNKMTIHTITQYYLSEAIDRHLTDNEDNLKKKNISTEEKRAIVMAYSKSCREQLKMMSRCNTDVHLMTERYKQATSTLNKEEQYTLLPKISMICLLRSPQHFFHTLHSFLKLDYPRDKLQLVIVDDTDSEKKLKHFLPEDSRIKIINITKKGEGEKFVQLPVGYKLNTGVKYSDNDIVFHFLDTQHYFVSKFRSLVWSFLMSGRDAMFAGQTAMYTEGKSVVDAVPSIANMMYNKNFWKVDAFDESYDDSDIVCYNYIKNRRGCVGFAPFPFFSFGHTPTDYLRAQGAPLPFSLIDTAESSTKESLQDCMLETSNHEQPNNGTTKF